jgi:hypothetical protein
MSQEPNNEPEIKSIESKSTRQIYIEMLRHRAAGVDSADAKQREAILWEELIQGSYVNGHTRKDTMGIPCDWSIMGPTVKGRLFLMELEELEAKHTLKAKFMRYGIPAATFILGAMWSILVDWFKKKLGL